MNREQRRKTNRILRNIRLPLLTAVALIAALGLGAVALNLSRHETEFRRQELQSLLKSETRLFAERCRTLLDEQRTRWEELAKTIQPKQQALRQAMENEPFFVAAFLTDRNGTLLEPADPQGRRRYRELFEGLVSAREVAPDVFSNVVMPQEQALIYQNRTNGKRDDLRRIEPISRLRQNSSIPLNSMRKTSTGAKQAIDFDYSEAALSPEPESPAPAAAPAMTVAETDDETARLIPRFQALTRRREAGYIPWFADNRFAPLVWAKSRIDADRIVGFELDHTVLLSRLIPLFPTELPEYFRIELVDAADQLIHFSGGPLPTGPGEPVLVMPFPEQLLPNVQIRAYLLPQALPLTGGRIGMWAGVTALLLVLVAAGGIALYLTRRELRIAGQKSSFVSQVSHELKTPLTSIRMYSELLRERQRDLTEEKRKRYLQVIMDESERLTRLVGNVLDFSRLDENRKNYHPESFDLTRLLHGLLPVWQELAQTHQMTVNARLPHTPCPITFDQDALRQVLYNLFSNAVKYAAGGKQIDLILEATHRPLTIILRDYGPGIPAASREKIFRKFYRVDDALTAGTGGFGLGLAIARQLMRDQGGDLSCRDATPGCEFLIHFPEVRP